MNIQVLLIGFAVGTMMGLTGMGGGSLMGPVLIFLMGIKPTVAVGTDLFFASITQSVGALAHHRHKTVDYDVVKVLLAGSLPGALAGMVFLTFILKGQGVDVDLFIRKFLAFVLFFVALSILFRSFVVKDHYRCLETGRTLGRRKKRLLIPSAFVVGFLVSLTSVGSGTLVILLFSLFYRFCPRRMVGTDIVHGLVLTATAGFLHLGAGHINFSLLLNLLAGSLPGVYLGSQLCVKLPREAVRYFLAVSLLIAGIKLF